MKRLLHFYYLYELLRMEKPKSFKAHCHNFGLLFNWRACWLGWHYSKRDKRLCVNILPCLTLWWTKPGGNTP